MIDGTTSTSTVVVFCLPTLNTAVAVAIDANGTPSAEIVRNDFTLMDIPDGDFTPYAKISAGERICATLAYFDVEMEKTAMSCFYRLYTAEEAANLKNASDQMKKEEAISIANEGWGVANNNYSFNSETNTLTGSHFKTSNEVQVELKPDTEYVVLYVAKNGFADTARLIEYCYGVANKYGTASSSLAALMYDTVSELEGAFYPAAEKVCCWITFVHYTRIWAINQGTLPEFGNIFQMMRRVSTGQRCNISPILL